ncbi:MAG: hypothetical protein PHI71_15815 [Acidiphilium sp.]|jgi:hypothetical protein|nr:hypothetical protein [Acidiphilium sp.]
MVPATAMAARMPSSREIARKLRVRPARAGRPARDSAGGDENREEEGFFFVKKKQKTFFILGMGAFDGTDPEEKSFFASFCSQKEVLAHL